MTEDPPQKTLEDCLYISDFNPSLGLQELHNRRESQDHPNTVNLRVHFIPAYQKQRNNNSATSLPFKDLYLISRVLTRTFSVPFFFGSAHALV